MTALLFATSCGKRTGENDKPDGEAEPTVIRSTTSREVETGASSLRDELAAAESLENPSERHRAIAQVAWRAITVEPELAREALVKLPPTAAEHRLPLLRHFAMQMAHEDPDAALAWAEQLGVANETAVARTRIAVVLADSDPRLAATVLAETGDAGRDLDVAIVEVLQHWAGKNAAEAADWIALFPEGNFRAAGMRAVIPRWLGSDPAAAMRWLSALNREELRAEAMNAAASALAGKSQATREAWLESADATTREAIEQAMLRQPPAN